MIEERIKDVRKSNRSTGRGRVGNEDWIGRGMVNSFAGGVGGVDGYLLGKVASSANDFVAVSYVIVVEVHDRLHRMKLEG